MAVELGLPVAKPRPGQRHLVADDRDPRITWTYGQERGDYAVRIEVTRRARGDRSGPRLHPERMVRGSAHPDAKLTDEQVINMRTRYAAGGIRQVDLASEFLVSQTTVSKILRRAGWRYGQRKGDYASSNSRGNSTR